MGSPIGARLRSQCRRGVLEGRRFGIRAGGLDEGVTYGHNHDPATCNDVDDARLMEIRRPGALDTGSPSSENGQLRSHKRNRLLTSSMRPLAEQIAPRV